MVDITYHIIYTAVNHSVVLLVSSSLKFFVFVLANNMIFSAVNASPCLLTQCNTDKVFKSFKHDIFNSNEILTTEQAQIQRVKWRLSYCHYIDEFCICMK